MKIEIAFLNKLGGLLGSAAVRWWMSKLDYKVLYDDPAIDPVFSRMSRAENLYFLARIHPFPAVSSRTLQPGDAAEPSPRRRNSLLRGAPPGVRVRSRLDQSRRRLRDPRVAGKSREMHLTITPDGPRGPRRQLAPGCVYLASKLGLPLVAMGFGYDRPWRVRSAWDQLRRAASRLACQGRGQRRSLHPARPGSRRPGASSPANGATAEPFDRGGRILGRQRRPQARAERASNAVAADGENGQGLMIAD